MFKRKDWVFLRKGQGIEGEASSTSSSGEDSDSVSDLISVSTGCDSGQEEKEAVTERRVVDSPSTDLTAVEGNALANQIDEWCSAARSGDTIKGRALTCMICAGKKLLLNSSMFSQHITSGKHRGSVSFKQNNIDNEDLTKMFCFADDCKRDANEDIETHTERLERVKSFALADTEHPVRRERDRRKRKTRPGKRQRQEMKIQLI